MVVTHGDQKLNFFFFFKWTLLDQTALIANNKHTACIDLALSFLADDSVLSAQGCYRDSEQSPDLPDQVQVPDLLPAKCVSKCEGLNKRYAGVQVSYCVIALISYQRCVLQAGECFSYDIFFIPILCALFVEYHTQVRKRTARLLCVVSCSTADRSR